MRSYILIVKQSIISKRNEKKKRNRGFKIVSENKRIWADEELRRRCLTAEDLAVQITTDETISCEISHDTVTKFLNAEVNIDKDKFTAIAKKLGKSPEWFLEPGQTTTAPREAVKHFSGQERNVLLEELKKNLAASDDKTVYSITGRSGIGKTEQILKFIDEDKILKKPIFNGGYCFVRAEMGLIDLQIETFFTKFKKNNPACPSPPDELTGKERVQGWYDLFPLFDSKILIVFDNVGSFEQISDYLPNDSITTFRIVATTQNISLCRRFENIALRDIDDSDAESIIQSIITDNRFVEKNKSNLLQICKLVGRLPLAIDAIIHFIRRLYKIKPNIIETVLSQLKNDRRLAEVLCEFSGDMEYVLDRQFYKLHIKLQNEGLRAVYDIIWETYDRETKEIALSLAYFAPGEVSYSIIRKCFPDYEDKIFDDKLGKNLVCQSFIDVNEERFGLFRLHELTRIYLRESLLTESTIDASDIDERAYYSLEENFDTIQEALPTFDNFLITFHAEYYIQQLINDTSALANKGEKILGLSNYLIALYKIWRFTDKLKSLLKISKEYYRNESELDYLSFLMVETQSLDLLGESDVAFSKSREIIPRAEKLFRSLVQHKPNVEDKKKSTDVFQVTILLVKLYLERSLYGKNTTNKEAKASFAKAQEKLNCLKKSPWFEKLSDSNTTFLLLLEGNIESYKGWLYQEEEENKRALSHLKKAERIYTECYRRFKKSSFIGVQNEHDALISLISTKLRIINQLIKLDSNKDFSSLLKQLNELVKNLNLELITDELRGTIGIVYRRLGDIYIRREMLDDALLIYNKALEIYLSDHERYSDYIAALKYNIRFIDEAIKTGKKLRFEERGVPHPQRRSIQTFSYDL